MRSRLCVLLTLAVLPLAGCGESDSGSASVGADPAKVVPASAPLYVEVVVRPDGELGDGVEDALKKILRTDDPGKQVVDLFNKVAGEDDVSWDELKEWLGPRIGVYLTEFSGDTPVGAVVAETTDADKAKATLDKLAKDEPDVASAIVGDYAVFGSAEGVKTVQATAGGEAALSETPDYAAARDAVAADEALAVVYVEPQGVIDAISKAGSSMEGSPLGDPQALDVLRQAFAKAGRAAAVSLHADGDAVRIDGATIGASAGSASTAAADSLAALPADAWLAVGFGDIGEALSGALSQLQQLASFAGENGPDFEAIFEQFERKTGVDVREDFLSWMGDGAVYVRGRSVTSLGGALTIESKNATKSRKAVGLLAQGLQSAGATVREATVEGYDVAVEVRNPQVPVSLFIAANDDRFSVGVNPQALTDVLDPAEKLGDSSTYESATDALGGLKPLAIVDTPTIIGLVEGFGAGEAEGYDEAKPYLDVIGPISLGTGRDGDVSRFSLAVGLR